MSARSFARPRQPVSIARPVGGRAESAWAHDATIGNQAKLRSLATTGPASLAPKLAVGPANDPLEHEADRVADRVMGMSAPESNVANQPPRPGHSAPVCAKRGPAAAPAGSSSAALPSASGRKLDPVARNFFEPRFNQDLSGLRVHDDAAAQGLSRSVGARAFAHGSNLYFGAGEYAPGTASGRRLLAHEIAHTLQPQDPGRIARKTLTDLPAATQTKLMIARSPPTASQIDGWITSYFNPKSGVSVVSSITAEFGAEITDVNQQKGLRSIAVELANLSAAVTTPATATTPAQQTNADPGNWPLPPDSIAEIALDLRPQGGEQAIFRIARYTNGSADTVLIEKTKVLAPAPVAGAAPAAPAPQPAAGAAPSFTGDIRVGSVSITIDPAFGNANGKKIADAVGLLPDPIRAKVDGVHFEFESSGHGPGGQNGDYQQERDVVRIWQAMFDMSARRVGEATETSYEIVHELGHVIDQRPEFKAQRDRTKAQDSKKDLEKELRQADTKFVDPNDLFGGQDTDKDPRVIAEKKRIQAEIAKVQLQIDAADADMAKAKSVAGAELGGDTESMLTEFGKAIKADGVTPVTNAKKRNNAVDAANDAATKANKANPTGPQTAMKPEEKTLAGGVSVYAATDLMEAFAENFAYYALDEATFKTIRPTTYAFFVKTFPKTVVP